MKKIAPFTLKDPDICVKCGNDMAVGTEATWLREADAKGYYHPTCEAKPNIEALKKVRVAAADSPLGYVFMRKGAIPASTPLGETTPATKLILSHNPTPKTEEPKISADGILIEALAQTLLPKLTAALGNQPRNRRERLCA